MKKIKWILVTGLVFFVVYTRFVNIGWGLPYPMHPDERNMANAIQGLNCEISNCLNPHFFAYGQVPLYLGYILIKIYHLFIGQLGQPISFVEAVMALRIISAVASILTVFVLIRLLRHFIPRNDKELSIISLIFIFSPVLIQFAHFGTTESLLMLFYTLIVYYSLKILKNNKRSLSASWRIGMTAVVCGLAIATKVSSLIFIIVPLVAMIQFNIKLNQSNFLSKIVKFIFLSFLVGIIFSPHNIISFDEFISSLRYESDVATGKTILFYTRQFIDTVPILFQFEKIFPYALGWPAFVLGMLGFLGLSWRDKKINLLRLAFLVYFLPNAFLFAKWTRFMAPMFPLMLVFAVLFLEKIKVIKIIKVIIVAVTIIPGMAYLSVYQNPDVRFAASDWIYKNITKNSYILSETANVVDLPLSNQNYKVISFNFYDLDYNQTLQEQLQYHLSRADYIIVPSRRIFTNHPKKDYPKVAEYYEKLFSGKLGFKRVIEFSSYPNFKFQILNFKFKIEFPDEQAEETWTVFDHPVVRIYKRLI